MISANYFEDNLDIDFILSHWTDWATLAPLVENNFRDAALFQTSGDSRFAYAPADTPSARETYRLIVNQYGEIMGKELSQCAGSMERQGLKLNQGQVHYPPDMLRIMDLAQQAGLIPYACSREHGGLGLPLTAQMAAIEITARAHVPFSNALVCFNAAEVVARFGSPQLIEQYVGPMTAGDMAGAMAFTEPNYGSDLKNILTKAEKNGDGFYYITGTKRFITHACGFGEKPAAILTLARSGAPGAKGLSFFLVESRDVEIAKLEEKMGQHTSPTCEVVFDRAKARLIGEEGAGLVKYAMAMMNAARLGVAAQAVGLATAAYREAQTYAAQRVQFNKTINEIPAVQRLLNETGAYVHAMRAILYRTAQIVDTYDGLFQQAMDSGLNEREARRLDQVRHYDKLAKLLTPVSKLFATEKCNTAGYNALQVFGGVGYTEEFDIARIVRDMRITSIYEGTSQLQVIAAIGGLVEGLKAEGFVLQFLDEEIAKTGQGRRNQILNEQLSQLVELVEKYRSLDKYTRDYTAWDIVFAFAYFLGAVLLEQQCYQIEIQSSGNTLENIPPDFFEEKMRLCTDFLRLTLRQCAQTKTQVEMISLNRQAGLKMHFPIGAGSA